MLWFLSYIHSILKCRLTKLPLQLPKGTGFAFLKYTHGCLALVSIMYNPKLLSARGLVLAVSAPTATWAPWAAWYNTELLIELMPKGTVFSLLPLFNVG